MLKFSALFKSEDQQRRIMKTILGTCSRYCEAFGENSSARAHLGLTIGLVLIFERISHQQLSKGDAPQGSGPGLRTLQVFEGHVDDACRWFGEVRSQITETIKKSTGTFVLKRKNAHEIAEEVVELETVKQKRARSTTRRHLLELPRLKPTSMERAVVTTEPISTEEAAISLSTPMSVASGRVPTQRSDRRELQSWGGVQPSLRAILQSPSSSRMVSSPPFQTASYWNWADNE